MPGRVGEEVRRQDSQGTKESLCEKEGYTGPQKTLQTGHKTLVACPKHISSSRLKRRGTMSVSEWWGEAEGGQEGVKV